MTPLAPIEYLAPAVALVLGLAAFMYALHRDDRDDREDTTPDVPPVPAVSPTYARPTGGPVPVGALYCPKITPRADTIPPGMARLYCGRPRNDHPSWLVPVADLQDATCPACDRAARRSLETQVATARRLDAEGTSAP